MLNKPHVKSGATETRAQQRKRRADWRLVDELYRQVSTILSDREKENSLPDMLPASLAARLGRVLASYSDAEEAFLWDVFERWSGVDRHSGPPDDRFRQLYFEKRLDRFPPYRPPSGERRRPKPFEAVVETCRRLRDLNEIRNALEPLGTAGALGGSLSYGRFFNVCGAALSGKSSDTDLLVVISTYKQLSKLGKALENIRGLEPDSIKLFCARAALFDSVTRGHRYRVFSQKMHFWKKRNDPLLSSFQLPGHYDLSIHVLSRRDFDYVTLADFSLRDSTPRRYVRVNFDYRDSPTDRKDNQRSFSGIDLTEKREIRQVEGGYLSKVTVCRIEQERYYPGLHQNLILPQFELRWETAEQRIQLPLLAFKWKIIERLREERRQRPFEIQLLSQSHTRSSVFSPHVARRVDRDVLTE